MTESFASLQLPADVRARGNPVVELDGDNHQTCETWMIETDLPFIEAIARLSAFVRQHFRGRESTSMNIHAGSRKWTTTWSCAEQEITAQLISTGAGCEGYLRNAYR
jgi:hypothetical protein